MPQHNEQQSAEERYIDENADHGQGEEIEPPRKQAITPLAISKLTIGTETSERRFTPMDVDSAVSGDGKGQVYMDAEGAKRNTDGTTCEDCN